MRLRERHARAPQGLGSISNRLSGQSEVVHFPRFTHPSSRGRYSTRPHAVYEYSRDTLLPIPASAPYKSRSVVAPVPHSKETAVLPARNIRPIQCLLRPCSRQPLRHSHHLPTQPLGSALVTIKRMHATKPRLKGPDSLLEEPLRKKDAAPPFNSKSTSQRTPWQQQVLDRSCKSACPRPHHRRESCPPLCCFHPTFHVHPCLARASDCSLSLAASGPHHG